MRPKCEHGMPPDPDKNPLNGVLMAAPFDYCKCCEGVYYYIDEGAWSEDETYSRTWTKGLCGGCGGHYTEYRWKKGETELN